MLRHFAAIRACSAIAEPEDAAAREVFERNLLHRPAPQSVREAGVVNDRAATHLEVVVAVKNASGNQMTAE